MADAETYRAADNAKRPLLDVAGPAPGDGAGDADSKDSLSRRALVLLLFSALTFVATLEKVALKKAVDAMSSYQILLNQVVVLMFAFIFSGIVAYKRRYTGEITREMEAFPKWKLALISICDTSAGILILIPTRHVSGDVMTLLLQGVVPFIMLFSVVLLKKRFHWLHYVGTWVIIAGIFLNTLPALDDGDSSKLVDNAWYLLPLFISCIPMALSGICQQIALQDQEMDIYYYQMWVAWFQFLLSFIVSPLSFAMQTPGASVTELGSNFANGVLCWLPVDHAAAGLPAGDAAACGDAFIAVVIYLALCSVFNVLISLVVKYGNAVTMMVALTMAVPLQYIVFAVEIPFFVPVSSSLSALNWVGLAVTVIGLAAYHSAKDPDEVEPDSDDEEGGRGLTIGVGGMSPTVSPFGARGTPTASPRMASRRVTTRPSKSTDIAPGRSRALSR
uniref:EamA domain-containing protein n=1 Tax=Bicosoecida sp. CB-2014 TaxID=1486930 RepID=A0A7S1C895_9STRA|mmetsp:Transcript_15452/g.53683  ORF Transcript_15452/g.53683 Transcript_15452/m.53683 type:complete len:447 (+) Transcript_15452:218-1558(+)